MDPAHLAELAALDRTYWWHVSKRALALELLRRHFPPPGLLVEGGIGAGGGLEAFRAAGWDTLGLDLAPAAVAHARSRTLGDVRVHDLADPWPVAPGSARAVVLLDCLEHIARPERALFEARRALAPGGGVVVTVPAYPLLLGPWDRMLGHHRRYRSATLRAEAADAGLRVAWISHWNAFSLPGAVAARLAERARGARRDASFPRVPGWLDASLRAVADLERRLLLRRSLPVGLSLTAVLLP